MLFLKGLKTWMRRCLVSARPHFGAAATMCLQQQPEGRRGENELSGLLWEVRPVSGLRRGAKVWRMCVDVAWDSISSGGGHNPSRRMTSPSGSSVGSAEQIQAGSTGIWSGAWEPIAAWTWGVNHVISKGKRHTVPSANGGTGHLTQNSRCASSHSSGSAHAATAWDPGCGTSELSTVSAANASSALILFFF